jgi:hypothetical protein
MVVARGRALLALFQTAAPALLAALARVPGTPMSPGTGIVLDPAALETAYESLPPVDFSRDVLQRSESHLRLLAVPPCGWADLGTPERLQRWIRSRGEAAAGGSAALPIT